MKMFKRFAAALLVGVMALAMLTACGGTSDSAFEIKVQDAYMAALNKAYGTEFKNDSEIKALAATTLSKIADGKLAKDDVADVKKTDNDKNYLGSLACVENPESTSSVYSVIYYEEATAETINVSADMVNTVKTVTDVTIEAGKKYNQKIELTGLGVATKTIAGKTYVAIGYKLTK